ncbi:hypothetical protein DRP05_06765 [Archaeoglobales archaeon]|nr:MAG: hypothetical protein DRP05_06765 [Archaeoglobales archaeon]
MYGVYDYDFKFENQEITVGVEKRGGFLRYFRSLKNGSDNVEKILASDTGKIIVNPVEPLNLPKEITNYLEIEFEPIVIEPNSYRKVYLKFPIEIGVFAATKKSIDILDIFSLNNQKYSLYGPPDSGVICRWYKSDVFAGIPKTEILKEGVIELNIQNTSHEWVEMRRIVFESYGMKIYYNDIVSMVAVVKIINRMVAETNFINKPIKDGMKKALELYTARRIPVVERKGFLMEWGLK